MCLSMNKKILIIGPSWVGDMIMAQSLFKLIKSLDKTTQIDVLAPNWSELVLKRMPEITDTIPMPVEHGSFGLGVRYKIAKQLRAANYDQAIILTNSWKSALIPWFARIPIRTGWLGEMRWGLINDLRYLNKKVLSKMVQRYAALGLPAHAVVPSLAELPAPQLSTPPQSIGIVLQRLKLNTEMPILALCPGAAFGPAKRWPAEYFVEIAKQKLAAGWQVWLFGSQQDALVVNSIDQKLESNTVNLAGKINLLETIDLLSLSSAVVANDSGLLHMAASLDKPLVAIYGSTTPGFTPPLGTKSQVLKQDLPCSPCFKRECKFGHLNCMYQIKPERVLDAIAELEKI